MAAPAPVFVYNWTGLYLGGHGGYGWGRTEKTNINGNPPFPSGFQSSQDQDGWLGGLQGGFNYQFASNWVIGIEGDYSWSGIDGNSTEIGVPPFTFTRLTSVNDKIEWLATATGRIGYAVANWLMYAKGGVAWAHKETSTTTVDPTLGNLLVATTSGSDTRTGWTVGAGVEWGFWQNWSAKFEYNYMDFGTKTESKAATYYNGFTGLNPLLRDVDLRVNVVKLGVNARFNWMR